jgi:hypothetical protein
MSQRVAQTRPDDEFCGMRLNGAYMQDPDVAELGNRKGGLDAQCFRRRRRGYRVAEYRSVGEPGGASRLLLQPLRQALRSNRRIALAF